MTGDRQEKKRGGWYKLPRNVIMLGLVSFFTDVSSEMIYPLIPLFLVQTLGASPVVLGLIEGIAEATASLLKVFSGIVSDRFATRKPLILAGYGISSFLRPLIGLARTWPFVLFIRFSDRVGKGIRTSPRDALIAESTTPDRYGTAYSLHRAMDHAGALVGPLIAFLLLWKWDVGLRSIFFLAALPGILAVLTLALGVREPGGRGRRENTITLKEASGLGGGFYRYLAVIFLFTLGNASDAFILLKISESTGGLYSVPLLWGGFHLVKSAASLPAGAIADKMGKREVAAAGWIVYGATYVGFAHAASTWSFLFFLSTYALYYGLTEGVEKALVAELVPDGRLGVGFGLFHFALGAGALPASILFGYLWKSFGPQAAFYISAGLALLATFLLLTVDFNGKNTRKSRDL